MSLVPLGLYVCAQVYALGNPFGLDQSLTQVGTGREPRAQGEELFGSQGSGLRARIFQGSGLLDQLLTLVGTGRPLRTQGIYRVHRSDAAHQRSGLGIQDLEF